MTHFLLLTESDDNFFKDILAEILEPLGKLNVARVEEGSVPESEEPDRLIIIDATTVDLPERLVARLRLSHPERRIVVLTASPTWQRARAVFEAGAMDYLPKTFSAEELREAFLQAMHNPLPR